MLKQERNREKPKHYKIKNDKNQYIWMYLWIITLNTIGHNSTMKTQVRGLSKVVNSNKCTSPQKTDMTSGKGKTTLIK